MIRLMGALALSCLIFVLTLGGIFLGALLRRALPEHHLSKDSQDVVRLGTGLIGTIAALVLGLLIAAAKSSFDTQSTQITQITADIILLDNLLAEYGPEARPIREQMRSIIGPVADQLWREKQASTTAPFEFNATGEKAYLAIQALSPQNDLQRSLQARAAQVSTDLVQTRLSLFADLNVTVFTCLSLFALSASCAIFLILELSQPFSGLMMISSEPLRHALAPL